KVTTNVDHSFALKEDILPRTEIGWHFHPEYELTLIAESYGKRVIGDHVATFTAGDLLLIGPGIPHYMRNDQAFYQGDTNLRCRAIVAHFAEDFLGQSFFSKPEMHLLRQLLDQSQQALHIYGQTAKIVASQMEQLLDQQGYARLILLLDILHTIALSSEKAQLVSKGYAQKIPSGEVDRIGQVYAYLFQHFSEEVELASVAEMIHLSPSAFCKFIKRHTGKTFSQILNEIRVGHACKLLIESPLSIGEIAYRSGYANASYFNRKFRAIIGYAPLEYKRMFTV
ncbi:MAG: AraC family transcriptional regulator, partial [Bacteroidota bacterium]